MLSLEKQKPQNTHRTHTFSHNKEKNVKSNNDLSTNTNINIPVHFIGYFMLRIAGSSAS